jgi:hypothetical protein
MLTHKEDGAAAYRAGAIRMAPITTLVHQAQGLARVDAWYEGYDAARGHGPFHGTTAQAMRDAYARSVGDTTV